MKHSGLCSLRGLVFLTMTLALTGGVYAEAPAAPKKRLNVLLITLDTLRADRTSCYDPAHVQTPNIDALARRGTLFTRAYAHAPMTLPSHASIMLGTTPAHHGVHDNGYFIVRPEHLTLAEILKSSGYQTAAFVSANPLDSRFGLAQGFETYNDDFMPAGSRKLTKAEQRADVTVGKALDWLKRTSSKEWFLWLHLYDPHTPYDPPEPFKTRYQDRPYEGEVAFVDSSLGKIFDALEKDGTDTQTLIILTADHGESLGEHGEATHGFLAYDTTLRVPMIIFAPGTKPVRSSELACHADLVPTVCDLVGIKAPEGLQGLSLRPAMDGKSLPTRRIYFESLAPYFAMGWAPIVGYLEKWEKFIDSPVSEIYNLHDDPGEKGNLAAQTELGLYRSNLGQLIEELSPVRPLDARGRINSELKKKLESLGYLTRPAGASKKEFGPEDDVKNMLPIYMRIEKAFALEKQGKIDEAIDRLENLIKEPRTLDTAYDRLGELFLKKGDTIRAVQTFRAGLLRFPSSYTLLYCLAENLLAEDRPEEVLQIIRAASPSIQMDQDAAIWNIEGVAYRKMNDFPRAVESFKKARDADSEYIDALYNLGTTALSLGLKLTDHEYLAEAIRSLKEVTQLVPQNTDAHSSLGAALFSAGQTAQAVLSWQRALDLDPMRVKVHYFLGTAFYQLNNFPKALYHLQSYRQFAYLTLSPEERKSLDLLISRCDPLKR